MKICRIEMNVDDVKGRTVDELVERISRECGLDDLDDKTLEVIRKECEKIVKEAETVEKDVVEGIKSDDGRIGSMVRHIRRKYPGVLADQKDSVSIDGFEFHADPIGMLDFDLPSVVYEDYGADQVRPYFRALKKVYALEHDRLNELLRLAKEADDGDVLTFGFNMYSQRIVALGQVIICFDDFAEFIEDYEVELEGRCGCDCDHDRDHDCKYATAILS